MPKPKTEITKSAFLFGFDRMTALIRKPYFSLIGTLMNCKTGILKWKW